MISKFYSTALISMTSICVLSACVTTHSKVNAITRPAIVIYDKPTNEVINKIIEICDRNFYDIDHSTNNSVSCGTNASIFEEALFGNKYSTSLRNTTKFTIIPIKDAVKVNAKLFRGNQNAFGQSKLVKVNNENVRNSIQIMLNTIKTELEQN